ncbi:hypothetical protein B0J12DRAFT_647480 [Macrophomina phaseolina]|uniref:Uncharacterized protein n=1 Tax=Macrophomina phaseolina TaxID=35725 RepID=A0ABQ8GPC4_9PEZI|nr:hypothetical protein B0J12DRAFT_647480 [Macrophomina phaseolina]
MAFCPLATIILLESEHTLSAPGDAKECNVTPDLSRTVADVGGYCGDNPSRYCRSQRQPAVGIAKLVYTRAAGCGGELGSEGPRILHHRRLMPRATPLRGQMVYKEW